MGKQLKINLMKNESDYILKNGEASTSSIICLSWFPRKDFNSLSDDQKRLVIKKELGKIPRKSFTDKYSVSEKERIVVTEQDRHNFENPRFEGELEMPLHLRDKKVKTHG